MTAKDTNRALAREILVVIKEHLNDCDSAIKPDDCIASVPAEVAVVSPVVPALATIVDKNKADDIDLFFADTEKLDWKSRLEVAIEKKHPLYIMQEIFKRAPTDTLKMAMSKKLAIVATSLTVKRSDLARFFLDEFSIDVENMQNSPIKWGDLSAYDSNLCKELIERFDLPESCFTDCTHVFVVSHLPTLRWIVERFKLGTIKVDTNFPKYYDIVHAILRENTPTLFEAFMEIFCTVISQKFGRIYANADENRNLLRDCFNSGKMEQFDCLVKCFRVPDITLRELFKNIVIHTLPQALDFDTFKHFSLAHHSQL